MKFNNINTRQIFFCFVLYFILKKLKLERLSDSWDGYIMLAALLCISKYMWLTLYLFLEYVSLLYIDLLLRLPTSKQLLACQ